MNIASYRNCKRDLRVNGETKIWKSSKHKKNKIWRNNFWHESKKQFLICVFVQPRAEKEARRKRNIAYRGAYVTIKSLSMKRIPRPPDVIARNCLALAIASAGNMSPTFGSSSKNGAWQRAMTWNIVSSILCPSNQTSSILKRGIQQLQ